MEGISSVSTSTFSTMGKSLGLGVLFLGNLTSCAVFCPINFRRGGQTPMTEGMFTAAIAEEVTGTCFVMCYTVISIYKRFKGKR